MNAKRYRVSQYWDDEGLQFNCNSFRVVSEVDYDALEARLAEAERQRDAAVAVFDLVTRIPTLSDSELQQLIANCRIALNAARADGAGEGGA
jgi:hypothetical protein